MVYGSSEGHTREKDDRNLLEYFGTISLFLFFYIGSMVYGWGFGMIFGANTALSFQNYWISYLLCDKEIPIVRPMKKKKKIPIVRGQQGVGGS